MVLHTCSMGVLFIQYSLRLLFFTTIIAVSASNTETCYFSSNETIVQSAPYTTVCGSTQENSSVLNCCTLVEHNLCLSSSICYDPNILGGSYTLSPCTDPTYSAPECPQYCSKHFSFYLSHTALSQRPGRCC